MLKSIYFIKGGLCFKGEGGGSGSWAASPGFGVVAIAQPSDTQQNDPYKPKADGLCPTPHKKPRALALPLSRAAGAVRTDKRAPLRGWAALADQGGSPPQRRGPPFRATAAGRWAEGGLGA